MGFNIQSRKLRVQPDYYVKMANIVYGCMVAHHLMAATIRPYKMKITKMECKNCGVLDTMPLYISMVCVAANMTIGYMHAMEAQSQLDKKNFAHFVK